MSIDLPVELRPSRRRRLVVGPCGVGAPTGRPPQLRTLTLLNARGYLLF